MIEKKKLSGQCMPLEYTLIIYFLKKNYEKLKKVAKTVNQFFIKNFLK